ncbi:Chromosome segregation ATPase [gamma proteobacterium IMCC1989]|nr:Chromosome segregation ATPase [gamma proteobacterium IMCC1989]
MIDEIQVIMSLLLRYGFEAAVAGGVVFLLIKSFLPGYLSQKGKNLATQDDIESITYKVELVKSSYAELLEEVKSNNQIKIAAISREKIIKKEVYMDAIEAITISQSVISNLANLNLTEEKISKDFSCHSGKIARVQLVGEKETVRAVTTFTAAIGTAFLDLMLERGALVGRKADIERTQNFRDRHHSEIERYMTLMKTMNVDGLLDQGTKDNINKCMLFEGDQREYYNKELERLWTIQNEEHLVFVKKCMDKFFDISILLPPAVLSARKELDLEIEAEDYENIFNENIIKGREAFDDFVTKISV